MLKSKRFVIVSILVAVVLVAGVALTGNAVFAQDGPDGQGRKGALVTRVAEILGIDQQTIEDAFKQAQSELRQERMENWLQKLIDEGEITQEQADDFTAWLEDKPADMPSVGPRMLDRLVEEGKITQEQADEYLEWLEARPDIPMPRPQRPNNSHRPSGNRPGSGAAQGQMQGFMPSSGPAI